MKGKLKCEMIWKIWKKGKSNSGKIWKIQKKIVKRYENKGNNKITELRTILQRESQNS